MKQHINEANIKIEANLQADESSFSILFLFYLQYLIISQNQYINKQINNIQNFKIQTIQHNRRMQTPMPTINIQSKLKSILQKDDSEQGLKQFKLLLSEHGNNHNKIDMDILLRWVIQNQKNNFDQYYNILIQGVGLESMLILLTRVVNIRGFLEKKTNLMIACEQKKQDIVQTLLKNQHIDCLLEDHRNKNALFYAIVNKNKASGQKYVRMLLKKCPKLITNGINKNNPLLQSLNQSKFQIAKTLLQLGMNPNQIVDSNDNTIFHETIKLMKKQKNKNIHSSLKQILQVMLENKADPYFKNKLSKNAIDIAQAFGNQLIILYEQIQANMRANQKPELKKQPSKDKKYRSSNDIKYCSPNNKFRPSNDKYQPSKQKYRQKTKNDQQAASAILRINNITQREQVFTQAQQIYDKYKKLLQTKKKSSKPIIQDQQQSGYESDPFQPVQNFTDKLTLQIENYEKICTNDHKNARKQLDEFMGFLRPITNQLGFDIEIYGSYATELWINHCDIDILLIPVHQSSVRNTVEQYLQYIGNKLKGSQYQKLIILRNTKIPLIRIQVGDDRRGRKIDLSILSSNNNGRQHVQYVNQLKHVYPEIKPLFFVAKKLSHCFRLNDPLKSGVRSFALFLMLVIFMNEKQSGDNLGTLLVKFLYKYGYACDYDYEDNVMVLRLPDPVNAKNNIGKKTDAFSLQRMFKTAYLVLHTRDASSRLQYLFQSREMFIS